VILYKFYSFDAGLQALKSSQLGFREPGDFNDPFELLCFDNLVGDENTTALIKDRLKNIRKSVAILSLTKNPLNPLMWAHYAMSHTGFVVGYDVDIPLLLSEDHNLITVDKGEVIYASTKPAQLSTSAFSELVHVVNLKAQSIPVPDGEYSEQARRLARELFLTKSLPWCYEEEVRVVKSFDPHQDEDFPHSLNNWNPLKEDYSPNDSEEIVKGLKIYSHEVQIKEVYLGDRNKLLRKCSHDANPNRTIFHKAEKEQWKVFKVSVDENSWDLKADVIDPDVLIIGVSSQGALNKVSLSATEALFLKEKLEGMSLEVWDSVHVTNWSGKLFIKKNAQFQ